MNIPTFHVADEELLLYADGEMAARDVPGVRTHLETCWRCRARRAEIEKTIGDFVRMYQKPMEDGVPSIEGPKARLLAQIRERMAAGNMLDTPTAMRVASALTAVALAAAVLIPGFRSSLPNLFARSPKVASAAIPRHFLTPGETVSVTARDVCSPDFPTEEKAAVPASLQSRVFEEYGLNGITARSFKVDYLINPDLGGATSLRNLWPEPDHITIWDARAKDQLELRLKSLVCSGKVDLATAQRDLARDWIASYKRYFRADTPIGFN